jgi:catechol 2,3-dioxygenase-like lactoylglutathione lyase family enzyme
MWDHVGMRNSDFAASVRFYSLLLDTLGVERTAAADGIVEWDELAIGPESDDRHGDDYYGGFLLDPDGNSAEAVHHGGVADDVVIDHLWIRVADVEAAKAFYVTIADDVGIRLKGERPGWAHFAGAGGTFSLVPGKPTLGLHMAFPAPDRAAVQAFHRTATGAGYRDNGGPGERPEYHPGYCGAFVLDPDGNNIEAVFHDDR